MVGAYLTFNFAIFPIVALPCPIYQNTVAIAIRGRMSHLRRNSNTNCNPEPRKMTGRWPVQFVYSPTRLRPWQ